MKLFSVGKVGLFLDDFSTTHEKRKERGAVNVLKITLRAQPFTHQLASAVDPMVRNALFKLSGNAEPLAHIRSTEFHFPFERQLVTIFATPDTVKPSIAFDQIRILSVKARTEKGVDGYALLIKAQFEHTPGQLTFVDEWKGGQRFVTCEEAEPMLDDVIPEEEDDEDEAQPGLAMEPEEALAAAGVGASKPERSQRRNISHAKGKSKKRR